MKVAKAIVCLFILFFCTSPSTGLLASENEYKMDNQDYIKCQWGKDEENIYLIIQAADGLQFNSTHRTKKDENGWTCEVRCRPSSKRSIISSDGYELTTMTLRAQLIHEMDPPVVRYIVTLRGTYVKGHLGDPLSMVTHITTIKDSLDNCPPIDWTQSPQFFTTEEALPVGMIVFHQEFFLEEEQLKAVRG